MKNNGLQWFERMADVMFSDRFQAKAIIATFGTLGVVCLIGAFWNPWQLMFAGLCAAMVLCGFSELKKEARAQTGSAFSNPDFHKYILDMGSVPFDMLFDRLEDWCSVQSAQ